MPFTSLSPKKGPEESSGPCTLYYPNELYEHKEFFFKFCMPVKLPNKDLWPLNRGRKRYSTSHDCNPCCDTKAQRSDSPPPPSHLPRYQQRGNKNKQNKRIWYLLQRRSEPPHYRKECSGIFTHPFKIDIKHKYSLWCHKE